MKNNGIIDLTLKHTNNSGDMSLFLDIKIDLMEIFTLEEIYKVEQKILSVINIIHLSDKEVLKTIILNIIGGYKNGWQRR